MVLENFSQYLNFGGGFFSGSFFSIIIWGLLAIPIVLMGIFYLRYRLKYVYNVEIEKRRQNEKGEPTESKKVIGRGAYITKGIKTLFRIKYGWQLPWQKFELNLLPDPKYMDSENRVYYLLLNKDTLVQAEKKIDWEDATIKLEPVDLDLKYGALLDAHERGVIFETESTWKKTLVPLGIMTLIFLAGIITLYFIAQSA